jgi:hypothetical protein
LLRLRRNFAPIWIVDSLTKEEAMLGEKKTLPLWHQRRPDFLSLERALTSPARDERGSDAEHAVIERMAERRRFEESKGKVRPPA